MGNFRKKIMNSCIICWVLSCQRTDSVTQTCLATACNQLYCYVLRSIESNQNAIFPLIFALSPLSRILLYGVSFIAHTICYFWRLLWPLVPGQTSSQPASAHLRHLAIHAGQRGCSQQGPGSFQRPCDIHPWGNTAVGGAASRTWYPHHRRPLPLEHQLSLVSDPSRAPGSGQVPVHRSPVEEKLWQHMEQSSQPHFQPAWDQCCAAR